ncbi:DUF883 family protein [Ideonella sp. YS5]|uniref:DUF883 family protein n=1 Tax=Ideonella sp. YS5 TaxID=3453714 RepID=UPI003EE97EB5
MDTPTLDKQGLAQSLRRMIDEADGLLKSAARSGDEAFDSMRDQFTDQVQQMRSQLDQLEETAVYRARRAARAADHSVHEHPYGAMGVAAAVGLLVGVLIGRR